MTAEGGGAPNLALGGGAHLETYKAFFLIQRAAHPEPRGVGLATSPMVDDAHRDISQGPAHSHPIPLGRRQRPPASLADGVPPPARIPRACGSPSTGLGAEWGQSGAMEGLVALAGWAERRYVAPPDPGPRRWAASFPLQDGRISIGPWPTWRAERRVIALEAGSPRGPQKRAGGIGPTRMDRWDRLRTRFTLATPFFTSS